MMNAELLRNLHVSDLTAQAIISMIDFRNLYPVVTRAGRYTGEVTDMQDSEVDRYDLADINDDGTLDFCDGACDVAVRRED